MVVSMGNLYVHAWLWAWETYMCMVVSMGNLYVHGFEYGLYGYDYVVMIGKQVYDPSVWLSRKLDMETSSFPHLCILDSQDWIPKTIYLYWCKTPGMHDHPTQCKNTLQLFMSWRLIYSISGISKESEDIISYILHWLDMTTWHYPPVTSAGYGCEYIILQYEVYDRHPSVWLSRKLDMETSSFRILVQKPVLMGMHDHLTRCRMIWLVNKEHGGPRSWYVGEFLLADEYQN